MIQPHNSLPAGMDLPWGLHSHLEPRSEAVKYQRQEYSSNQGHKHHERESDLNHHKNNPDHRECNRRLQANLCCFHKYLWDRV